jgi:hypothetical protein
MSVASFYVNGRVVENPKYESLKTEINTRRPVFGVIAKAIDPDLLAEM